MDYIAVFISLLFVLHSCKGSESDSSEDQDNTDSLSQVQQTSKDTVPTVPPPGQKLAPGQVCVEGFVITVLSDQTDSKQTLRLHIQSILGYGPSTPPIPTGDTLDILVETDPGSFQEGAVIHARLQHNVSFKNKENTPPWSLINVKK